MGSIPVIVTRAWEKGKMGDGEDGAEERTWHKGTGQFKQDRALCSAERI